MTNSRTPVRTLHGGNAELVNAFFYGGADAEENALPRVRAAIEEGIDQSPRFRRAESGPRA